VSILRLTSSRISAGFPSARPVAYRSRRPEGAVAPEFALQAFGLHAPGGCLHRVEDLDARFDQVRDQLIDAPAIVHEQVSAAGPFRVLIDALVAREEKLAVHAARHLRSRLHAQVVATTRMSMAPRSLGSSRARFSR